VVISDDDERGVIVREVPQSDEVSNDAKENFIASVE
jgi:hypothetical protein